MYDISFSIVDSGNFFLFFFLNQFKCCQIKYKMSNIYTNIFLSDLQI